MKKLLLSVILLCFAVHAISFGALNAYMRLTGSRQGEIKGSVTQAGREDSIMVIGFSHDLVSPRDAATGLPTGKRQHSPVRITKEIDRSTPLLMNAWANNEVMSHFELRFWRPSATGQEEQFYTLLLHNASIVSIKQEMLNNKYPENVQHKEREHISFCYTSAEWIFEDGGISYEDNWVYEQADIIISDLNGDGIVNVLDLGIFASQWLTGWR